MHGSLSGFIVSRKWTILESFRRKEPATPIRFHNEGIAARYGIHPGCAGWWYIVGRLVERKIRDIIAGPLLLFFIPPDILLALGPGTPLWICRCTVIEDTSVGGPGKAPLQICIVVGDARC